MTTLDSTPVQQRPPAPRRLVTLAIPLVAAVVGFVVGGALAGPLQGALWGLIATATTLAGLRLARVETSPTDQAILAAGLVISALLVVRVFPGPPQTLDVLLSLKFAGAWVPAGVAAGMVAARRGVSPAAVFTSSIAWVIAGALGLPMTQALGVLTPIDTLRRGVEPVFGAGDYMTVGLIVGTLGAAALIAVLTRMPGLVTAASVLVFTLFAAAVVGFSLPGLLTALSGVPGLPNIWPPNFAWAIGEGNWWWLPSWEFGDPFLPNPLIETIRIAISATVFGCFIALPIAFMASTLTAPNRVTYLLNKGFLNFIRTIPDLFWAMIFVASIGFGPFAGALALTIFSLSIMGKLLSETVDAAEPGPLEAAKAAGGSHFPAVRSAVLPQVLPNYIALLLYIFELNIRASAVLGIVGAGGVGRVIEAQRIGFRFDRILAVLIPILAIVLVVEQVGNWVRARLV